MQICFLVQRKSPNRIPVSLIKRWEFQVCRAVEWRENEYGEFDHHSGDTSGGFVLGACIAVVDSPFAIVLGDCPSDAA